MLPDCLNYTSLVCCRLFFLTHAGNIEIRCFGRAMATQTRCLGFDYRWLPAILLSKFVFIFFLLAVTTNWGTLLPSAFSYQSCGSLAQ